MLCQNCRNEIGNQDICPYCGADSRTVPIYSDKTKQTQEKDPGLTRQDRRHLANLDTWGLLCVVLLAAIFLLELLRLIYAVIG